MKPGITGEEIDALRALAKPLLEYACDGGAVDEFHAHYARVTEGRDVGKMRAKYSSCGDLAHWLLYSLGVRLALVNRKDHQGWRMGMNVSMLSGIQGAANVGNLDGFRPELGDILIVWNTPGGYDAHVICVLDYDAELQLLTTAEYGQPGGAIRTHTLRAPDDHDPDQRPFIGRRRVQRWIRLAVVLQRAAEANLLAPPALPWQSRV
jgi:hypothetical protein